jgi:hypothetical protein
MLEYNAVISCKPVTYSTKLGSLIDVTRAGLASIPNVNRVIGKGVFEML